MAAKAVSARDGPAAGPPNQTLYCINLPDKLRKHDLRLALYTLFSTYGTVLDVVAMKTKKMRGQAHIVFKDVQASTQAMRALQGFEFFGKEMKIVYAKGASDVIARLRGTYSVPTVSTAPSGVPGGGVSTELQKSIFGAPPGTAPLPSKPAPVSGEQPAQGVKRPREESDEEEAPMDEESDVSMEASSDED